MTHKCEAPAGKAGATRDLPGRQTRTSYSLEAARAQFLVRAHHVHPEWAALIASIAFGGAA